MITIIFMTVFTAGALFFLIQAGMADRSAATEIVLCRAWSYRFARQTLVEQKEDYIEKFNKYHTVKEKKAAKKVQEWDKQISAYEKSENTYYSGKKFSVLDMVTLFGYRLLAAMKLDGNNGLLRTLTASCEHTGYIELERGQETGEKKNSSIYAFYLLASLFSFLYMGLILACFLGVLTIAMGNGLTGVAMTMLVGFGGCALYGYVPYDNLQAKAKKRQEAIDLGFPNAISEIVLLVMAGMSVTKAIEETAASDDSLMYRELRLVLKEMNQGATVQGALTRLQCRCDNKYLDKMVTIVAKSYTAGSSARVDCRY